MSVSRILMGIFLIGLGWGYSATASADTCWASQQGIFAFGTVTAGQSASATNAFTVTCNNYTVPTEYARICINLMSNKAPLTMTPAGSSNYPLYFNVYAFSNRDQPLSVDGSQYAQLDFSIAQGGSATGTTTLVGQIIAGQTQLAATQYYNYGFNFLITYALAASSNGLPSCAAIPKSSSINGNYQSGATADIKNGCAIQQVSDMNFGQLSPVNAAQLTASSTSTITVSCPVNTTFSVALGNGLHGTQSSREMCNAQGSDCIPYQLYQDPSYSQVWNTTAVRTVNTGTDTSKTLTVYGRVPSQNWPTAGDYTDTVTVNLSY